MSLSKRIMDGSISVIMKLEEALPMDFPAEVLVSYGVCSDEEPDFRKFANLRISVTAGMTIEQMWEAASTAINTQEDIT